MLDGLAIYIDSSQALIFNLPPKHVEVAYILFCVFILQSISSIF